MVGVLKGLGEDKKMVKAFDVSGIEEFVEYFDDEEIERFFEKYEILEVLGSGGFGAVFAVRDIRMNKKVALKMSICKDSKEKIL